MSVGAADLALQAAIFAKLIATAAVTDLLFAGADSIFDAVPDAATTETPYITIGDHELQEGELKGCERWIGKVTLNVKARQQDALAAPVLSAKTIIGVLDDALDDTLAVTGYDIIVLSVDFSAADIDPLDEKTVLGRLTYNIDMVEA